MIAGIWASFRALPLWVQFWVAVLLVPVNLAALAFIGEPGGAVVALLMLAGIGPNAVLMLVQRGFSKAMAISHVVFWTPLVALLLARLVGTGVSGAFGFYLLALCVVDAASLAFDYPDLLKWRAGDRDIAGTRP